MDSPPINSYPDEVTRKWKEERDRYKAALENIIRRDGDFPYARDVKQLAREALRSGEAHAKQR
jgi:hypothetical protein